MVIYSYVVNTDVSTNLRVASASVIVITVHLLMDEVSHNCLVHAGIVSLNPVGSIYVCLLQVLCIVRKKSLCRDDH